MSVDDGERVEAKHEIVRQSQSGFVHVGKLLGEVLKEVSQRFELRQRLEAEHGGPISDDEFIQIAERTGIKI